MDCSLGRCYPTITLLLTSSPPPPPPLDLSDGRNYLVFWSFYQTARGFPKHLEQLMELEWSVTLRVEIGSWKQRHPVRLMLESDTWDGLGSNPHPTHKGKQLAKNSETLSTPKRASGSCSPGAMPGGDPPQHRDVALCSEGQRGCFGLPDPNPAPIFRLGGALERSQYFAKGNEAPWVIWRLPAWHLSLLKY